MTELGMGLTSELQADQHALDHETQMASRRRQGSPFAFLEIRARGDDGLVAWDGVAMGELEVRGPWVAGEYADAPDGPERYTPDGWFRTGDIVTVDPRGSVELQDRAKDLVKSGGEWISSSALESALLAHPGVAEAAIIAVPHARWVERPLALVVRADRDLDADTLRAHLASRVASWWVPERFEFVDALPRTTVGKVDKVQLRTRFT
jgi:fatty-acyl-CoA synthase